MPQARNTEEILRELIRSRGTEYLRKGNLFVNAVEDMGGTKGDVRLLRYLVEVDGANALLDAGGKPQTVRQTIYNQTVEKICDHALVSPEYSNKICAIFWRAVYNEVPPATYKGQEKLAPSPEPALKPAPAPQPESKPDSFLSEPVPPSPPEPSPRPTERKAKFALFRPEHSTSERWLLMLGRLIILAYALLLLALYIRAFTIGKLPMGIGLSLCVVTFFIFPVARRQYCLWNQVTENWKPSKKLLSWIYEELANVAELAAFGTLISPLLVFIPDFAEILNESWMYLIILLMGFPFYTIYYICCFFWHRRRKKKA